MQNWKIQFFSGTLKFFQLFVGPHHAKLTNFVGSTRAQFETERAVRI